MHPYLRIRPLTEEEYTQLREMSTSRKLCAERVKRAQIILLSNQGHLADQVEGPPHTLVVLSARLHRAPLADDRLLYDPIISYSLIYYRGQR